MLSSLSSSSRGLPAAAATEARWLLHFALVAPGALRCSQHHLGCRRRYLDAAAVLMLRLLLLLLLLLLCIAIVIVIVIDVVIVIAIDIVICYCCSLLLFLFCYRANITEHYQC